MALRSPAADVRRDAIAILRDRDPRDFGLLLVAMLRDRIKFEVRRVNGPGSRGELLVKGPDVNVDRLYSPPPMPFIPIQVGDSLSYDAAGLPVLNRSLGSSTSSFRSRATAWRRPRRLSPSVNRRRRRPSVTRGCPRTSPRDSMAWRAHPRPLPVTVTHIAQTHQPGFHSVARQAEPQELQGNRASPSPLRRSHSTPLKPSRSAS